MRRSLIFLVYFSAFFVSSIDVLVAGGACDQYITMINSFPDGYRAKMILPVIETMNGWRIEIQFDKNITVIDTPHGNLKDGIKAGEKFDILNHHHNRNLQASSKFMLEYTIHYVRGTTPPPKIIKIKFGKFSCESDGKEVKEKECIFTDELQNCNSFMRKVTVWPDGFRAKLTLPIKKSVQSWKLLLIFNKPIKVLDFPQGNLENKINSTEFIIKSKDYNGRLKEGGTIIFDMTIHYERGQTWTNVVAVVFDPVEFICTNNKYKEILERRYSGISNDDLIGANWLGNCEEPIPQIPQCKVMFELRDYWPDGFRGYLKIPIKRSVNGWNVTVFFEGEIRNFDVNQGDKIISKDGVYFVVRNHEYNANLVGGTIFRFEITVHFSRDLKKRPEISLVQFNKEDVCENTDQC